MPAADAEAGRPREVSPSSPAKESELPLFALAPNREHPDAQPPQGTPEQQAAAKQALSGFYDGLVRHWAGRAAGEVAGRTPDPPAGDAARLRRDAVEGLRELRESGIPDDPHPIQRVKADFAVLNYLPSTDAATRNLYEAAARVLHSVEGTIPPPVEKPLPSLNEDQISEHTQHLPQLLEDWKGFGVIDQRSGAENFEIGERLVVSKTGRPETCEDLTFANDNFVAVIDGVSAKSKRMWPVENGGELTGGQMAPRLIAEALSELPPNATHIEAIQAINEKISARYEADGLLETVKNDEREAMMATAAVLNVQRREIWLFGDGQALIGDKPFTNPNKMDEVTSELRSRIVQGLLDAGFSGEEIVLMAHDPLHNTPVDPGRAAGFDLDRLKTLMQNKEGEEHFPLAVITGLHFPESLIRVTTIPEGVTKITLASDGYPEVRGNLRETEALLDYVHKEDPLMIRLAKAVRPNNPPPALSHDDRTYAEVLLKSSNQV